MVERGQISCLRAVPPPGPLESKNGWLRCEGWEVSVGHGRESFTFKSYHWMLVF